MKAKSPSHFWTQTGIKLQVRNEFGGHKWLGCILGVRKVGNMTLDINHHVQAASQGFFAIITSLRARNVLGKDRAKYFYSESCGGLSRWAPDYPPEKILRAAVGPPSNLDWSRPWHENLHDSNGMVQSITFEQGMKLWGHRSLTQYLKLAMHFAALTDDMMNRFNGC